MSDTDLASERAIPPSIEAKFKAWKDWSFRWGVLHHVTGFTSAFLTAVIAAHTKHAFLPENLAVTIAAIASGLTFLVTTLGAQKQSAAFEAAYRVLERAMATYRLSKVDPGTDFLAQAEIKGIDVLDSVKG
jgi:hypothetical protein